MPKVCSACKREKDIDEFNINRATKDGRQIKCRKCTDIYMEKYRKNQKGQKSKHDRRHYLHHIEEISNQKNQQRLIRERKIFEECPPDKEEVRKSLQIDRDKRAASIRLFYLNQNKEEAR